MIFLSSNTYFDVSYWVLKTSTQWRIHINRESRQLELLLYSLTTYKVVQTFTCYECTMTLVNLYPPLPSPISYTVMLDVMYSQNFFTGEKYSLSSITFVLQKQIYFCQQSKGHHTILNAIIKEGKGHGQWMREGGETGENFSWQKFPAIQCRL